ncbi:MAG: hypothetical protein V3V57_02345 [Spirochaetia bacterium]
MRRRHRNAFSRWSSPQVIVDICVLPPHLTVQELILWPLVQQVEPL